MQRDQGATAGREALYAPSRERSIATNAWAFLHWLAVMRGVRLADWQGLLAWSRDEPEDFRAAIAAFARLDPDAPWAMVRQAALLLLLLDIRPDDRLLGASCLLESARLATVLAAPAAPEALFEAAAQERASVVIAPAADLGRALFRRIAGRHDLAALREVVALGGPLTPNERTRLYTWVKADVMLIGLAGETAWGDPLSPVLREPFARAVPGILPRPGKP